jgi:hypothetical protein
LPNEEVRISNVRGRNKKNRVYEPLSQAQFLRMWRKEYKRVIIPKV